MGAIYIPWLADASRATGYPVVEERGWRTRGNKSGGFRVVEGVAGHHTAGPKTGEYPCRNIILNGRTGLPGPLANLGLGRSGTIYVVAAGAANHAGYSAHEGFTNLNDEYIGIEAEDDGDGLWTPEQIDCYPRLVASLLSYMNRGSERYAGHKDIAIPLGRKPDPAGIDTGWMRLVVGEYLANKPSINKNYAPLPAPGGGEPLYRAIYDVDRKIIGLVGHNYFRWVNGDEWAAMKAGGCVMNPNAPDDVNHAEWDIIRYTVLSSERL